MTDATVTPIRQAAVEDGLKKLVKGTPRFWVVEHNPQSTKSPVKVILRERIKGVERNLLSLSKVISHASCIATPESVLQTAEEIIARAGRIDEVVGIYG